MLELVQDHRSGNRLEIVIPTLNVQRRITNLLRYYGNDFDIVLLDGGSADQTLQIARDANVTIFRRLGETVGDLYFVHYANEVSKSGLSFYLFADEFIAKSDLEQIQQELSTKAAVVWCDKTEWMYGRRMLTFNHLEPRGFRRGYARCDPNSLHENLRPVALPDHLICQRRFPLQHLHVWSIEGSFGKIGTYSRAEVERLLGGPRPFWHFLRRYVISLLGFPLVKVWGERGIGLPRAAFWHLFDLAEVVIATLCWIERTWLMSSEEQLAMYAQFYGSPQAMSED